MYLIFVVISVSDFSLNMYTDSADSLFINVKKLQFIHMLTATDVRTSKTAKIKKLFYYNAAHRHTSVCSSRVK